MNNFRKIIGVSARMIIAQEQRRAFVQVFSVKNRIFPLKNEIKCTCMASSYTNLPEKEGFLKRVLKNIPFLALKKNKMKLVAYSHYESMVDQMNYLKFFDELDIPDTFYGWFVVTELHLWMLAVRCMAEGQDGRFLRNSLVEALWADVYERVKKLGATSNPAETRARIVELSEQLQATFIAYDEGLQSEDHVLAGALWRRFYQQSEVDLKHLELLIKYIRRNMNMLENLNQVEFYDPKSIKWIPIG